MEMCGDADKLARVFNNLLKNAAAYSEAGTEVIVTAKKTDVDNITARILPFPHPEDPASAPASSDTQ